MWVRLSVRFSSRQWLLLAIIVEVVAVATQLSVRFSSRQWLLRSVKLYGTPTVNVFQSAFHRGNGCYRSETPSHTHQYNFQSAFHRGNGCYQAYLDLGLVKKPLSVRFSSRQWLLPHVGRISRQPHRPFSPLFIAAMVATLPESGDPEFISHFQSAFHRGNGCYC